MRIFVPVLALVLVSSPAFARGGGSYRAPRTYAPKTVPVRGYVKPTSGQFVMPHQRAAPTRSR